MRIFKTTILIFKICLFGNISSADTIYWSEVLDQPKFNVIFLRHALAPGYGDPSEFDISECKTQRNLNQEGRDQAISIGIRLKDIDSHVKFDTEEACEKENDGRWNKRFDYA